MKMKMNRFMIIGLSLALAMSMTACGSNTNSSSGTSVISSASAGQTEGQTTSALQANQDPENTTLSDETLHVALASEPSTLWGAAGGKLENEDVLIEYALFDTLVRNDPVTGEVVPNLAEKWEWTDDTHCKFNLRDDVMMSDGTPLVADDVVYTVNVWKTQSAGTDTGMFIEGATADDDHTVTIGFTTATPDLLSMLGWAQFGIVSEDEVQAAGGLEAVQKKPVIGSGRYKFAEWQNGTSITLERNDNYWNKNYKGYYKKIVITFVNDPAARALGIESGDIDIAYNMPVVQTAAYVGSDAVSAYIFGVGQVEHLWYNMGDNAGATKDIKVRQAIDKALDFDAIAQVGTAGFGQQVLGYAGPMSKYYSQTFTEEERKVDIEGAKKLLEEAGYGNGLDLTILGTQDSASVYTVIQENLEAVGIHLTINIVDTAKFVEDAFGGKYDLISVPEMLVTRAPNVFPFLRTANVEGEGMVIGGPKWTTDELDSDIQKFIEDKDADTAKADLVSIEKIMKEEMVCSNLYGTVTSILTANTIKGVTSPDRGYVDMTTLYKE